MQLTKFYKMNMVELTNSLGDKYCFKNILTGRMPDFMDGILPVCV